MKTLKELKKQLDVEREQKIAEKRFERLKAAFEDEKVGLEYGGNASTNYDDFRINFQATPAAKTLGYPNPKRAIKDICKEVIEISFLDDDIYEPAIPPDDVRRLIRGMPDQILAIRTERWFDTEFLPMKEAELKGDLMKNS